LDQAMTRPSRLKPFNGMFPDQSRRLPQVPRLADLSKGEAPLA
jgi:hypothetical protein